MLTYIHTQTQTDLLISTDADLYDVNTAQPQIWDCKKSDLNSIKDVQGCDI